MKLSDLRAVIGAFSIVLCAQAEAAHDAHRHAHSHLFAKRHSHDGFAESAEKVMVEGPELEKRSTCSLPSHPDLVPIPGASNNGFAMSPDQPCVEYGYCPIACKPGKVMAQWQPHTSYKYPESMVSCCCCGDDDDDDDDAV